jgi:C1A family cysteine protease
MSTPKGMAMVHSVCDNLKQIEEDYPPGIMGKSMDMPVEVDFRERCSPIKDQGHLN